MAQSQTNNLTPKYVKYIQLVGENHWMYSAPEYIYKRHYEQAAFAYGEYCECQRFYICHLALVKD